MTSPRPVRSGPGRVLAATISALGALCTAAFALPRLFPITIALVAIAVILIAATLALFSTLSSGRRASAFGSAFVLAFAGVVRPFGGTALLMIVLAALTCGLVVLFARRRIETDAA